MQCSATLGCVNEDFLSKRRNNHPRKVSVGRLKLCSGFGLWLVVCGIFVCFFLCVYGFFFFFQWNKLERENNSSVVHQKQLCSSSVNSQNCWDSKSGSAAYAIQAFPHCNAERSARISKNSRPVDRKTCLNVIFFSYSWKEFF